MAKQNPETFNALLFNARDPRSDVLPGRIAVELAMACNLECKMCPVPTHDADMGGRERRIMKPEVFREVLDKIRDHPREVHLNQLGEPLLNKRLVEFVRLAAADGHKVTFVTNATLLNPDLSRALIDAGLAKITFSFDGATKETYERIRIGASYDVVVENIVTFCRLARESDRQIEIHITLIESALTKDEIPLAKAFWAERAPNLTVDISPLGDWGGQFTIPAEFGPAGLYDDRPRYPCSFLWDGVSIGAEGNVMYCCHDYKQTSRLPNVMQKDLRRIWAEDIGRERERQVAGKIDQGPCQHCSAWRYRPATLPVPDRSPLRKVRAVLSRLPGFDRFVWPALRPIARRLAA